MLWPKKQQHCYSVKLCFQSCPFAYFYLCLPSLQNQYSQQSGPNLFEEGRTKSVSEIITSSGIFSLSNFQSLVHISPPVPQSCLFAFFHNCLPQRGLLHFSVSKNYVLIFVLSKNFVGDPGTLVELLLKAGGASDLALAPLLVQLLLRLLLQSPDVVHRHPMVSVHPAKHLHKKELFFYFFLIFSSTCL